ncbi:DUF7544 domain-containing protein [Halohasta salina]|uniref:DUF7544 domain-containing protein n=1 Tax=Halohasta salina TaxID=2961621 RepID=UPI0020A58705|nr:hypothetical protein [Halohasta salina]
MSLQRNITEAGGLTRTYLAALGAGGWLKLGIVVLFLGGIGAGNVLSNVPVNPELLSEEVAPSALDAVAAAVAAGVAIYAVFGFLAAVFEFVFVDSLRTRRLPLWASVRTNLRPGVRLLVFRTVVWLATIAVAGGVGWLLTGGVSDPAAVESLQWVAIGSVAFVAVVGATAVDTLTNGLVVPIMLQEGRGPIDGWRRLGGAMAGHWSGGLAFLLVAWVVGITLWVVLLGIGFVVSVIGLLAFVFLATALTELHAAFEPVVVVVLFVAILAYQYLVALVTAPVRSYVRYYGLLVLGDADPTLDLLADRQPPEGVDSSDAASTDSPAERSADSDDPEPTHGDDEPSSDRS